MEIRPVVPIRLFVICDLLEQETSCFAGYFVFFVLSGSDIGGIDAFAASTARVFFTNWVGFAWTEEAFFPAVVHHDGSLMGSGFFSLPSFPRVMRFSCFCHIHIKREREKDKYIRCCIYLFGRLCAIESTYAFQYFGAFIQGKCPASLR